MLQFLPYCSRLELAHQKLDAAYGWPVDLADDDLLARLLELNLAQRAAER